MGARLQVRLAVEPSRPIQRPRVARRRTDRSTVDPRWTQSKHHAGTVPVFTYNSLDEGGAQLCPCGIATVTPQHFTVASRANIHMPTREFPIPTISRDRCAPHPAHIRQIGAGEPLRDVVTLVPHVLLFVTLAEPECRQVFWPHCLHEFWPQGGTNCGSH